MTRYMYMVYLTISGLQSTSRPVATIKTPRLGAGSGEAPESARRLILGPLEYFSECTESPLLICQRNKLFLPEKKRRPYAQEAEMQTKID